MVLNLIKLVFFNFLLIFSFQVLSLEKKIDKKEIVTRLLKSIETRNPKVEEYIDDKKFVESNYNVKDSIRFDKFHRITPHQFGKVNIIRIFEDGNYVFAHTDYGFKVRQVGFDIFRFEGPKVVEHWGGLTKKIDKPNASGKSQIDGSKEVKDLKKTNSNKKIVKDYVQTVLGNQKVSQISKWIDVKNFQQHSVLFGDYSSDKTKGNIDKVDRKTIDINYNLDYQIFGEGNFVLTRSQGNFNCDVVVFYDLFRLERDKIVEHWDVISNQRP